MTPWLMLYISLLVRPCPPGWHPDTQWACGSATMFFPASRASCHLDEHHHPHPCGLDCSADKQHAVDWTRADGGWSPTDGSRWRNEVIPARAALEGDR